MRAKRVEPLTERWKSGSCSSFTSQRVGQTQTHRLNRGQNSDDEAERDRKHRAEDQIAPRDKKDREKLPDKTGLPQSRHHQPADQQTEDPAEEGDDQRFPQNDDEDEF